MSAETVIASIISTANEIALETKDAAIGYADTAQTVATTVTDLGYVFSPVQPDPQLPDFLPDPDGAEDKFRTTAYELYNALGPEFDAKFSAFLTRFFPVIETDLQTSIDGWITNTINNGATGIPTDVENQIWERSRARELRDFGRRDDELISTWAGRGFSMPPGALYAAQQAAQQELTEKISTHSRDVAIKQAEIQIDSIKFAVGEGIKLRTIAMESAIRYLQAWLDISKISVEYANGILRARTALYGVMGAYYGALIDAERLIYDWGKDQAALSVRQKEAFVSLVNANVAARVNAAVSAANAVSNLGVAALGAQNSLAHVANVTNVSG